MVVIGGGRVGRGLEARAAERGVPCDVVTRDAGWDYLKSPPGSPILVAVPVAALQSVLVRVPMSRHEDLVFVQNGRIAPWLGENGLQGNTRGILFFGASGGGAPLQIGPPSPFCGPHATAMVYWFERLDLPARIASWPGFLGAELEKMLWLASFGLMCTRYDCDVGTVLAEHRAEHAALVEELAVVARVGIGIEAPPGYWVAQLRAYGEVLSTWKVSLKEWSFRNGWFIDQARRWHVPIPIHDGLTRVIGGSFR